MDAHTKTMIIGLLTSVLASRFPTIFTTQTAQEVATGLLTLGVSIFFWLRQSPLTPTAADPAQKGATTPKPPVAD